MTNPYAGPQVVQAIGSAAEKTAEGAASTKSGKSLTNRVDNSIVDNIEGTALKNLVVNNALCGVDQLANLHTDTPFCTKAVDNLFDEYLQHSTGPGAVLIVHDVWGNGKSTTVAVVARGHHPMGPDQFLIISPKNSRESGSAWLKGVKLSLGMPEDFGGDITGLLEECLLRNGSKTEDRFRVTVAGERNHATRHIKGKPLLVLEDLNPDFFSDQNVKGVFDEDGSLGQEVLREAKEAFGHDAFNFLNDLGVLCYNHGWVAIVTTMYPRVAKFLHKFINGGTKVKISASLIANQYHGGNYMYYIPETFAYDKHFVGLWNPSSKEASLFQLFPDRADEINTLLTNYPNLSVRSYCNLLSKTMINSSPAAVAHAAAHPPSIRSSVNLPIVLL